MIVCKTNEAHAEIKSKFQERDLDKIYHTVVVGKPKKGKDVIVNYVMRHPKSHLPKMVVTNDTVKGKKCITEYSVLKCWKIKSQFFTLLEIKLHTGRTHQIRVTMAALGHPVAGDVLYHKNASKQNTNGLCLLARRLAFEHPFPPPPESIITDNRNKEQLEAKGTKDGLLSFEANYPAGYQQFLDHLDKNGEFIRLEEEIEF
eukprot:TRINITY_DN4505_c0_g1_i1.p1 TRINITY_DN4505_c0_g1~~TRINITY_DN4505_c0_g1_i1.p1  ORF type:complete len:202 (+),score=30.33 TRINITY_DN4505_c0_g1_i1:1003-1608(+)